MKIVIVNPKVIINKKRNEVNDVIDHSLIRWLKNNSYNPIVLPNQTIKQSNKIIVSFLKKLNPKGIVLSGGNDVDKKSIRYEMQLLLIKYSQNYKIPLLGICQGMQMMGVLNKSKLIKVKNHVRKNHKLINLTKENFPSVVNSYHDYALNSCPKNFSITTTTNKGDIESIKHKKLKIEGWMWHPERDKQTNKVNNFRLKKLFG
jgi:gamma-glutamyl-gamma-aminobutyrate hydrolase PuuD